MRPTRRLVLLVLTAVLVVGLDPGPAGATGTTCAGVTATLTEPNADGIFLGTRGRDVIVGTAGADVIRGRGGDDLICGGGGDDLIYGGPGDDRIFGEGGSDTVRGGPGHDYLLGGDGNDLLIGGRGIDRLRTQVGTDEARGGPGWDYCDRATTRRSCQMVMPAEVFEQGFTAEDWRPLVTRVFGKSAWDLADEVDNAIRIIDCESNGDPWAYNAGGPVAGLFQHRTTYWESRSTAAGVAGRSYYDPLANITVAAYLVHQDKYLGDAPHGPWTDWNGCGPHPGVLEPPWESW
jgi:hypothetical protein